MQSPALLEARHAFALGGTGTSSDTTVETGATLQISGGINLPESLIIRGEGAGSNGSLCSLSGNNRIDGEITLNTADVIIGVESGSRLELAGRVHSGSSALGFTKRGPGTLVLGNDVAGTVFTGPVSLEAGTLLANGTSHIASTGNLSVATTTTLGGDGSYGGPVNLNGTLEPGNGATAALTLGSGLTLQPASTLRIALGDWTTSASSRVVVTGATAQVNGVTQNPVNVSINSAALMNFTETNRSFTILQAPGGLQGNGLSGLSLVPPGIGLGTWQLRQSGDLLELAYTAPAAFSLFMNNYPSLVGGDRDPGADPDLDGISNFNEFANGSRPDSATSVPLRNMTLTNDSSSGSPHLVLTLTTRAASTFTGSGPMIAIKDGVLYRIEGSTNLSDFTAGVEELSPSVSGYEYRSFRLTAHVPSR